MKLKIKRSLLLNALTNVSRAVSLKSPIPALTGIKFDLSEDSLTLTGSDSDITIQTKLTDDLEIEEPGAVVLSSRYILEIVKKLDNDIVSISTEDETQTKIEGVNSVFDLNGTQADDYPKVDLRKTGVHFTVEAFLLKDIIDKTFYATSEKETRPILTGVNFKAKEGTLLAVATDSYRLAQMTSTVDDNVSFNIIIPKKSLQEISRIIDKDELIDVYVSDRSVLFVIDDFIILSRLIEGTYPDTSKLFSDHYDYMLLINSDMLLKAVDRASLFSDATTNIITLSMAESQIIMKSYSQEIGSGEEDLSEAIYQGEPLQIAFSARYLSDAIRSIGTETVKIRFTGKMRPFVLTDQEKEDNIQVVLPVRTY